MSNLFDRMKLFVQRDKEFRSALYDIMGFYPHNVELYRIAFAHKSQEYKSKKTGDRPLNNERLEFLGDAVLETVVSDIVYHHFKNKREGFLTNTRSKIVSRESLGKLAKDLGIDRLIQSHTNSKAHNSFLAGNAFEALMGAIYLDRGFDYAFRFIEHRIMGSVLDLEGVAHKEVNFKSKLLEWSQKNRIRIDFKDKQIDASSSNTPSFSTTIVLEGLFAGDGKGFSKKEAHQNAAKDALTRMRREPKFIDDIFSSKEKRTAMEADPCFVLPVIDEIEAEIARENENRSNRKEQPKKEQSAKPESKKEQLKKEQPAKKEKPKKEQPKEQSAKAEPKKEQPKEQNAKAEPKKEQPKEQNAKVEPIAPIVIPIAFEDILDDTPADEAPSQSTATPETPTANEVHAVTETPSAAQTEADTEQPRAKQSKTETERHEAAAEQHEAAAEQHDTAAEQPEAAAEQNEVAAEQAEVPADIAAPAPAEPAAAKKPRRRGRRQNAAGFTNTDIIPAETSHRAEKAAKKVEEAKKEKARKAAKKSARKAAKGIDDAEALAENAVNTGKNGSENNVAESNAVEKSAANSPKAASNRKKQSKGNAEKPAADDAAKQEKTAAKKPRRRRKTKAELPSETPNPEREQAIAAAEAAAYQQPNED